MAQKNIKIFHPTKKILKNSKKKKRSTLILSQIVSQYLTKHLAFSFLFNMP